MTDESCLRPMVAQWRIEFIRRNAPWLDITALRKSLVDFAKTIRPSVSPNDRVSLDAFISGEGHVLPSGYNIHQCIWDTMCMMCKENGVGDEIGLRPFELAYDELLYYFFRADRIVAI